MRNDAPFCNCQLKYHPLTRGHKQRESSGQGIAAYSAFKGLGSHTPQNRIAMSSAD